MRRAFSVMGPLVVCLAAAAAAFAEEGEAEKKDELGFRERMTLQSLAGMLGLNEEQQAKVKEILIKSTKTTDEEIKKTLTADQVKKYDDMKNMFQGGPGGQGGRGFGRMGGMGGGGPEGMGGFGGRRGGGFGLEGMNLGRTMEEWKKRLNLDDRQAKKIEEIIQELTQEAMNKLMEKLPEAFNDQGRFDWQKVAKDLKPEIDKYIDKAIEKIRKELREDQLPEFEIVVKEFKEQVDGWLSGKRPERGDRGRRGDFGAFRIEQIMNDLKLPTEEAEILKPRIEEILNLQQKAMEDFRKASDELRGLIEKAADSAEVKSKLDALRAKRDEADKGMKTKQAELRELLTFEQEARLVMHRVLD